MASGEMSEAEFTQFLQGRLRRARGAYVDTRRDLIEELREVLDEYGGKIEEIVRDLGARRREYDAIVLHHGRLVSLFAEHQDHLERAANALLANYRQANRDARSKPAPEHFGHQYKLDRVLVEQRLAAELNDEELAAGLRAARDALADQAQRLADEFSKAVERYHSLDTLHPDTRHGAA